jgi:nitric oxide reductase large subunit
MSQDFQWPEKPTSIEQPSTNEFQWFIFFVIMFIVGINAVFFLPSVIAMAFPMWDLSWLFAQ